MLILLVGRRSLIYYLFLIEHSAGGSLPGHYTTSERYFIWCDYLSRKAMGKKIKFSDVEFEYLKKWNDEFQEAKKKFDLDREAHLDKHGAWWE